MSIFTYLLNNMTDADLYQYTEQLEEEVDQPDLSGAHLRQTHHLPLGGEKLQLKILSAGHDNRIKFGYTHCV